MGLACKTQSRFTPDVHFRRHSHSGRASTGSMSLLHYWCATLSKCKAFEWEIKKEGCTPVSSSLDDKNMGWQEGGTRAIEIGRKIVKSPMCSRQIENINFPFLKSLLQG